MKWILLLLLIPAAVAQDALPWNIDVDPTSIESTVTNATAGDWFEVEIFNFDEVYHNVTIEGQGTFMVSPYDGVDYGPFQIGTESFTISDDVSGQSMLINVGEGDFIDSQSSSQAGQEANDGESGDSKDTPAPLAILAIGAALLLRRK